MRSPKRPRVIAAVAGSALLMSLFSIKTIAGWPTEDEAVVVAEDLNRLITVGTGIVGKLQPMINSGKPDSSTVNADRLIQAFLEKYQHTAGTPLDTDAEGLLGESRRAFLESYKAVLDDHRDVLAVGGEDVFVPAYFRSKIFEKYNERLGGRVKGYATNREADLLNPDWSIDALMDYSSFAYYVQDLLENQGDEQFMKAVAGRVVGYYPMKLKQSCVTCHARHGLTQEVGAFGGALVTEVLLHE